MIEFIDDQFLWNHNAADFRLWYLTETFAEYKYIPM